VIPRWLQIVAIIAGLAAIVAFVPQGDNTADLIGTILSISLMVLFVLFAARLYQQFRSDIYGLGEKHRVFLYGALGAFVYAMAGREQMFDSTVGSLLWVALIAGAMGALYSVFMHWRSYRI
jgi:hypothetical protein